MGFNRGCMPRSAIVHGKNRCLAGTLQPGKVPFLGGWEGHFLCQIRHSWRVVLWWIISRVGWLYQSHWQLTLRCTMVSELTENHNLFIFPIAGLLLWSVHPLVITTWLTNSMANHPAATATSGIIGITIHKSMIEQRNCNISIIYIYTVFGLGYVGINIHNSP